MTDSGGETQNRLSVTEALEQSSALMRKLLLGAPDGAKAITRHLASSGGKGFRARLLLGCAMGVDRLVPESAVRAAASVELFHLATLVHDDVIDDAPTRRGIPTAQNLFGKKQAVIAGDFVLCLAMQCLSAVELESNDRMDRLGAFARGAGKVCLGELLQSQHSADLQLSTMGYLRIIEKKTAALFYLAGMGGAVVAGAGDKQAGALRLYGMRLGMIFQIVDDLKDYLLGEEDALKPVKCDACCGVITLPLIIAMAKNPKLAPIAAEVARTGKNAAALIAGVRSSGGTAGAWELVRKYGDKAADTLSRLDNPHQREELHALLEQTMGSVRMQGAAEGLQN